MLRYVRRHSRVYSYGTPCKWCGTQWGAFKQADGSYACPNSTCLACGSPQCLGNGLGRGACGICLVGLLPGWSGTDRGCGYKGCSHKAIAYASRVGIVCREHAPRATHNKLFTVASYIVDSLESRDDGQSWRACVLVDDALPPRYVNAGSWLETVSNLPEAKAV